MPNPNSIQQLVIPQGGSLEMADAVSGDFPVFTIGGRLLLRSAQLAAQLMSSWYVLAATQVAVAAPGDTNENVLGSVIVPAGAMGANGRLRITTFWSFTNNANSKLIRMKFGGSTFQLTEAASQSGLRLSNEIINLNNVASQHGTGIYLTGGWGFAAVVSGVIALAINTANAATIEMTAQKAVAGDAVTLFGYLVELAARD